MTQNRMGTIACVFIAIPGAVDVRRRDEWDGGHIEGATHIESLHESGNSSFPALLGCERCNIAIYCRTGRRSSSGGRRGYWRGCW